MGFCARPTPEMGGWSVEVRSESFYLKVPGANHLHAYGDPRNPGMVELLLEDVPALRAALDQAERVGAHGADYEWAVADGDGTLRPVRVATPAEYVDASSVPAGVWMQLLSSTGPLADSTKAHALVVEVVPDPSAVPTSSAEALVELLDGLDGPAGVLRSALAKELEEAASAYELSVSEALAYRP